MTSGCAGQDSGFEQRDSVRDREACPRPRNGRGNRGKTVQGNAAVSQHLGVLREAGLVDERRVGTKRLYVVRAEAFDELVEFIEGLWGSRLRRLKQAAEAAERIKAKK